MKVQSQILKFKARSGPRPAFLIMEVFVSLLFCVVFILVLLKFHGDILLLYERFFVRSVALDLAVNTFEGSFKTGITDLEQEVVYCGRQMKLVAGTDKNYVDVATKKQSRSKIVVVWQNSAGRDEKLTLGST